MTIDNETENRLFEGIKKSMAGDLAAGQRDLVRSMNEPGFVGIGPNNKGTFRILTEQELRERRGDY